MIFGVHIQSILFNFASHFCQVWSWSLANLGVPSDEFVDVKCYIFQSCFHLDVLRGTFSSSASVGAKLDGALGVLGLELGGAVLLPSSSSSEED